MGRLQFDFHTGAKHKSWDRVAAEAARTVPGRENGGNCDIKNLSRGCAVYLPVFVPGANLSMGDMHFSQGDGEVSFCGAIEMRGWLDLKCTVSNSATAESGPPRHRRAPDSLIGLRTGHQGRHGAAARGRAVAAQREPRLRDRTPGARVCVEIT